MAIIKTLRLQAFLMLSFLGAVQCAQVPTFAAEVGGSDKTDGTVSACTTKVDLKCTRTTSTSDVMLFTKDGGELTQWAAPGGGGDELTHAVQKAGGTTLDATNYGVYKCKAADSVDGSNNPTNPSTESTAKVTITCTECADNDTCAGLAHSYCKDTNPDVCDCKYGGTIAAGCNACAPDTVHGCEVAKHQKCKSDGKGCECAYGGTYPSGCNVCDASTHAGCSGGTPRCDSGTSCEPCQVSGNVGCTEPTKPYCPSAGPCKPCDQQDDGKPCDKATETCDDDGSCKAKITTQASPATGSSGGGTNSKGTTTKASVTSSAGTVTSTACLVIASVVVALMI